MVVFDKTGTLTQGACTVRSVHLLSPLHAAGGAAVAEGGTPGNGDAIGIAAVLTNDNGAAAAAGGGGTAGKAGKAAVGGAAVPQDAVDAVLALLAAAEGGSEHPLGKAIVAFAKERMFGGGGGAAAAAADSGAGGNAGAVARDFTAVSGRGLRCSVALDARLAAALAAGLGITIPGAAAATNGNVGAGKAAVGGKATGGGSVEVAVLVGNAAWMEECGVALGAAARERLVLLETQGCTAVVRRDCYCLPRFA